MTTIERILVSNVCLTKKKRGGTPFLFRKPLVAFMSDRAVREEKKYNVLRTSYTKFVGVFTVGESPAPSIFVSFSVLGGHSNARLYWRVERSLNKRACSFPLCAHATHRDLCISAEASPLSGMIEQSLLEITPWGMREDLYFGGDKPTKVCMLSEGSGEEDARLHLFIFKQKLIIIYGVEEEKK